jgi:hypothetical protein
MSKAVALAGLGALAGGLTGSILTAKRILDTYRINAEEFVYSPYRHQYTVEEFEERGEFEFTYYLDGFAGAFNRVGLKHIEALRARGYRVEVREIHEYLVAYLHKPPKKDDFALVHPLFFTQPTALKWLAKHHRYVVAFEVADTTKISRDYVLYANNQRLSAIFLPSTFAMEAYRRSGVMNKTFLVPHGVGEVFGRARKDVHTNNEVLRRLRQDDRIKILYFGLHSIETRKGGDVVREAVRRLRDKGRRFLLVVKTHAPPHDYHLSRHFGDLPAVKINTGSLRKT